MAAPFVELLIEPLVAPLVEPLIVLENISLKFPGNDNYTLRDILFAINSGGEITFLLGSNGSGKSSLLKVLAGTYGTTSGTIKSYGKPNIVTLTQDVNQSLFPELTVLENCQLWHRDSQTGQASDYPDYLAAFNVKLATHMQTKVAELSGGERQALLLALCFMLQPDLLLLDEHTSNLDPRLAQTIIATTIEQAKQRKISCVIITHNIDHALKFADRIVALQHGALVPANTVEEIHEFLTLPLQF
jgi:putative ABC transport system ATP-binding protein